MTQKKATFIISVYQDTETLIETIDNLLGTVNKDEISIIVVDDEGHLPDAALSKFDNVRLFHNTRRMGVGYSLHFGIEQSDTQIVVPMGCDIRFSGDWFDRAYAVAKSHPQSIISTVCAGLNVDRRFLTGKENHYYAAKILFQVNLANNRKEPLPFRKYLEAKWNGRIVGDVEPVGCCLGAIYFCHRDWFLKIRGFDGHRTWGNLESLVSLRSYISGGDCLIDCRTTTGHIFKTASSQKPVVDLIYNKLLVSSTLLPKDMEKTVYDWAATLNSGGRAIQKIKADEALVKELAAVGRDSLSEEELRRRIKKTGVLDP